MGRGLAKRQVSLERKLERGGRRVGAGLDGEKKLDRGSERGAFYRQTVFWLFVLERTLDGGVRSSRRN